MALHVDNQDKEDSGVIGKIQIKNLRYNPMPPPLKGGREFSKGPIEAFYKIEDILSLFADGKISVETAKRALMYARHAILPNQKYKRDILERLEMIYDEAINILEKFRNPKKIKEWLLSHGEPRKMIQRLDEFFKS